MVDTWAVILYLPQRDLIILVMYALEKNQGLKQSKVIVCLVP